ncbi:MAG: flavodoxin domain-containing protein [Pseudomonadota bacterium]|nr:flavodoxin domain-containing protein [Pseudomonadota bacterium]
MGERINVLVGSMTGTAEMVAEDMMAEIGKAGGYETEMLLMDNLDETVFENEGLFLIVTSTYGQGEVPDNALDFYEALTDRRPDLSRVRFGIFGLGDTTYGDTFNQGGARFEKILLELGATMIGQRFAHNASGPDLPEEAGVTWVRDWLVEAGELGAAA